MGGSDSIVIVGAGLAGAKAAQGAREHGFGGRVVLVGEEAHHPYERPPLSKAVLQGRAEPDSTEVFPDGFYEEQDIELVTSRHVDSIDLHGRRVLLDDADAIPFGTAVLATGAEPRRLEVIGSDLAGIHHLRLLEDAVALRDVFAGGGRIGIVGAGWIGSEVAASARQAGAEVVLVDPAPTPLERVLGRQVGEVFRQLHADHGVELRLETAVERLRGRERVEEMVLTGGVREPVDALVVGIGVVPRLYLATRAGLSVDGGVLVDEHLESSEPGVFAAGDVAAAAHPRYGRLRVEHWANALNQGLAAGRNAAGAREPYDRLPYFFSDQYDLGMEYVGHSAPADDVVVRGGLDERAFVAFWLRDGRVTAAMNVNVWDVVDDLKAIVEADAVVDPARLADSDVPLADLARDAGQGADTA